MIWSSFEDFDSRHLVGKDGAMDVGVVDGSFAELNSNVSIAMMEVGKQRVDPAVASHGGSA